MAGLAAAFGRGAMTQAWQDIANASLVVVWGANPSENHPACMAHVNRARFPQDFFTGDRANKKAAKLVVIDPRQSRTALQADMYVRIRPGTDIAFGNGLLGYILDRLDTPGAKYFDDTAVDPTIQDNYRGFLNQSGNGTFFKDTATAAAAVTWTPDASVPATEAGNASKYTDARFIVNADDNDYERGRYDTSTNTWVATGSTANTISDYPKKSTAYNSGRTVYNRLKTYLQAYDLATVADICGCSADEIKKVGDLFIQNSRHASTPIEKTYTRKFKLTDTTPTSGTPDKQPLWGFNVRNVSISGAALGDVTIAPGAWSARSMGTIERNPAGALAAGAVVTLTYTCDTDQAPANEYRATTILYAMGITQHTCGSQNVKMFANLQSILGNMGRAGGGINALRGIHNVQGSTDMGVLYHLIPGYSGNPSVMPSGGDGTVVKNDANAFGKYMDGLWGNTLNSGGTYDRAYQPTSMGLQQRGFYNMTMKWFGDYSITPAATPAGLSADRAKVDAAYSLWPKINGDNHIQMFRKMASTSTTANERISAAVVWGQNPAVTEPNQGAVRTGLEKLDMLAVVDIFETETVGCKRKADGITYFLPACSYVEKAGSVTNSGRALQWRYQATLPKGNSKDDVELLLRFAKQLDLAGAFSHIVDVWKASSMNGLTPASTVTPGFVYDKIYKTPYGGFDGLSGYDAADKNPDGTVGGMVEKATMRKYVDEVLAAPYASVSSPGSEWVNDQIFKEWASGLSSGGCLWLYTEGYDLTNKDVATGVAGAGPRLTGQYTAWGVANRAKSRDAMDPYGNMQYHKWGYSWLVNRRCIYNNSEVAGDQNDFFMGPDSCVRLFAPYPHATLPGAGGGATLYAGVYNYSRWYRTSLPPTDHSLKDKPRLLLGATEAARRPAKHVEYNLTGRFPAHTEPYESPSETLATGWGFNSTLAKGAWDFGTGQNKAVDKPNLVYGDTPVAGFGRTIAGGNPIDDPDRALFPLVLTSIRCVEHFQGGPITRNNWWNAELEPEPWVEINSLDARAAGIKDGDYVNVITARSDSKADQQARTAGAAGFAKGFRARVGVGLKDQQRVAAGVVAIPWHWGDRGLATGSRANDLCIDAIDANTTIPEYKACLCRIEKINS